MDLGSTSSSEEIKSRGSDRFQKQQRAAKIAPMKISKRLDKALNHTKQQNIEAKRAASKYDITEGLAERFQTLAIIEEEMLQDLRHDFELNDPYDVSTSDDDSYYSSGSDDGLSDSDYRPYSQESYDEGELSNSAEFFDGYDYSLDNESEHSSYSSEDEHSEKDDVRLLRLNSSDLRDEKDVRKSKNHKNHLSHQQDKQENLEKKVLTFAFSSLPKKGGHHSKTIYNIGRLEKRILSSYQEEQNPTEIAEQPKERARDIRKSRK